MKFDLHSHSTASDGKLAPLAVLQQVEQLGVNLFALTDHDTVSGFLQIKDAAQSVVLVSGIEFSTQWSGLSIHIVGLDFDAAHPAMSQAIAHQRQVREQRAYTIDQRLTREGMPDVLRIALNYCPDIGQIGRPHFAQAMLDLGYVKTMTHAFDKWLGSGKLGDVKSVWPDIATAVEWLHEAGGVAVLAHPLRYKLTFAKLRRLVQYFQEVGGDAVEVVAQQGKLDKQQQLVDLVVSLGLAGSGGSDFHEPDWAWAQLGKVGAMPLGIKPVWELFQHTQVAGQ